MKNNYKTIIVRCGKQGCREDVRVSLKELMNDTLVFCAKHKIVNKQKKLP